MNKETEDFHNQIEYIEALIEALKRQRERFKRLIFIMRENQQVLDQWTRQYLELIEMKRDMKFQLLLLSKEEKKSITRVLGLKVFQEYEHIIDETISQITKENEILTILGMENILKQIDVLIMESIRCNKQLKQGEKRAIHTTKDLVRKKIIPVCVGLALIGTNITLQSWASIISGGYVIYVASTN